MKKHLLHFKRQFSNRWSTYRVTYGVSKISTLRLRYPIALLTLLYFGGWAQAQTADFTFNPPVGSAIPHAVFFTDQSTIPDTWFWDFGDFNTSTLQNPVHNYTTTGEFDVKLIVTDTIFGGQDMITKKVRISIPTADFTGSGSNFFSGGGGAFFGCGPLTANFANNSTANGAAITDWFWDFGDGRSSIQENPTHTYQSPGSYSVSLTITDAFGNTNTQTRNNFVQVIGPDVNFNSTTTTNGDSPLTVTFQDQTIFGAPITSFAWDFGDGGTSNQQNPSHTYTTNGAFDVSLTITDLDGCTRTLTKTNFVNTIPGAFDVSIAVFEGNEGRFSVAAQESSPTALAFNNDGTKMFVSGFGNDNVNEYNLGVAFDVSTAVFAGNAERFSVNAQEPLSTALVFNTDGTKMFVMGTVGDDINEYDLTTAFDVSTAAYAGDAERFSIAAEEITPQSLAFNIDGTKMFVTGFTGDDINEYDLGTPFDVSTAVFAGDTERFSFGLASVNSITFSPDGTKMFLIDNNFDVINEYTLATAFDVSTAVFTGDAERFSVVAQENNPQSLVFNTDGTKMFVLGNNGNDINQYSLAAPVITGAVANQTVNDNAILNPFAAITIQDPNGDNVSATITLDENAKGVLTGTGLTGSGPYTLASTDAVSLQTALRALIFNPTDNRTAVSEATTLTLTVNDGTFSDTDNITTVVSSAVAPSVVISSTAADPINGAFTATFTFSEAVTDFVLGDISVGNGAASNFTSTSTSVYTTTITPAVNGAVTVDVAADVAQDLGTVGNTAATQLSITADLIAPTVTITSMAADPINGAFTTTFTFSEDVAGFDVIDITVGNGTASAFASISTSVYTATITPTTDGAVTVDVATNVAQDAATNGNTAATQFSIMADLSSPTVSIATSATDPVNGAFDVTVTFSEDVTGFDINDITVGNGTASAFASTSASVYTATITPTTDGVVIVDVAANVAQDAATNGNTAATQFSIEVDLTDPTITITSTAADPINGAFATTFTFSEDVAGFDVNDITVGNGTASAFASISTSVYTATITPTTDGAVTVDVAANAAQDAATNGITAATQFSIMADLSSPTVSIATSASDPVNGAFDVTVTFSEDVTGFDVNDITVGNGTANAFASTSASVYTATITPKTDGVVTVDVAANVAQDAATNGNTAATQFSIEVDLTDPTVTITSTAVDPINGAFTTIFTFDEPVTGFDINDITVDNGTASAFASSSAMVYTATITPTIDGAVTVDVAANVAQDAATNGNVAATQFSITADLTDPTVNITSSASVPVNGAFVTTFTFSEAVAGFDINDITVGNGTASAFASTSASVYSATITPTTDGAVTVDVAANVAQDAAANGNTAATQFSIEADLTDPTVSITSSATDPVNQSLLVTVTFSEDVTGFDINDITVGNGAASAFASTSASVYTATITPTTDGAVTVDVAANVAQDAATNGNAAATQFIITADLTDPTVSITSSATDPVNGAFDVTVTFSEDITGFDINDITVGNGTASAFASTSASVYTATITPTTDGAVMVDIAANIAQDAAANGNTPATQFSIEADLTDPTVSITSSATDPVNQSLLVTVTFSEAVTGFDINDITVGNGAASAFASTSASVYTATITPTTDGAVTVDVAANIAQDAATNGNTAATQFSIEADLTDPTVSIASSATDPVNSAFVVTITFDEAVTGFDINDITVGNGTTSAFASTSASVYTATITPTTDGVVTVDVAANVAQDAATNGNTAATQFSIEADLTDPTVSIVSSATDPVNGAFTTTFTFDEAVTGFDINDITVGNGTASAFASTSASVYTATITPITDGAVTVDIAANVAQDAATNGNTAATQFSIEADLTDPTVSIASSATDPVNSAFVVTITFDEAVTGFDINDITIGNGTASAFASTSASVYTATITPTTDGAVTVDVAANVAQDAATNGNTAATQFSITADLTDPTVSITSSATDPVNSAFLVTVTFSEAVTGFDINDITVDNGTASAFASTSASMYTATITPTTDGAVTVDKAANVAQDAATNGNTAATQFSIEADLTDPTVSIASSATDPVNGAFDVTFTFSEAVTGFDINDITVGNGTTSAFASTSASVYSATITPTTDGAMTVDVAANVAQDAATNGNTASTQFSTLADLTNPGVSVASSATDPVNSAFLVTVTFSEAVTGFDISDITVGNGTASAFASTSASVYTATIIPTTDGAVTVDVAANVAQDAATNGNTAATQFSITADLTNPMVSVASSATDPVNSAFLVTVTFSEAVTGFDISDITVGNGTASAFASTSASVYTATITPTTDGAVTVDVTANVGQDAATNGNTAAAQFSITADLTDPTVSVVSSATDPVNSAFVVTITFDEAVTGFYINDITVGNGTASAFASTSASVYTAMINPITDGAVTVDVAVNVAQDAATNGNTAATQFSIEADLTAPTVTVQNVPAEVNTTDPFTLTFSFSEPITDFSEADFILTNVELNSLTTQNESTYEAVFMATGLDQISINLNAGAYADVVGNLNVETTAVNINYNSIPRDITLSAISIDENNRLGDEVAMLSTQDADVGDLHTYTLVPGQGDTDNGAFAVSFDKLRAAAEFDFETQSAFNIRLSTDDGNGGVFEKAFTISINDINESPTSIALDNTIIDETDDINILIANLSTTDPDANDTFIYSLVQGTGSDDNASFTITNDQLLSTQPFNFEEKALFTIRVRVEDQSGLSFQRAVELVVNNVALEPLRDFTKDSPDARIKNFFTPNGDGQNDVWVIEDILDNPVNEVKVYSQGGELVFSTRSYQNDWAGTFKGQTLPSGYYYYEINIFNGQSIIRGMLLILTSK